MIENNELSNDLSANDLSLSAQLLNRDNNDLSILFPQLSNDYFANKNDVFIDNKKSSAKMTIYAKIFDLNTAYEDQFKKEDNKKISATEIGIKLSF